MVRAKTESETVTFNVGGKKFEVTRSLLDKYPASQLTTSASDTLQINNSQEIFFERNPILFPHVLEYLRDRKVHLPITVSKKAVLTELEFYRVDNVDEVAIKERKTQNIQAAQSSSKIVSIELVQAWTVAGRIVCKTFAKEFGKTFGASFGFTLGCFVPALYTVKFFFPERL